MANLAFMNKVLQYYCVMKERSGKLGFYEQSLQYYCLMKERSGKLGFYEQSLQYYCLLIEVASLAFMSKVCNIKAAYSVTFDLLILELMFLFFKNTAKQLIFR